MRHAVASNCFNVFVSPYENFWNGLYYMVSKNYIRHHLNSKITASRFRKSMEIHDIWVFLERAQQVDVENRESAPFFNSF